MFLNHLEEKNKNQFLKLCMYAILSNGVFAKEEKEMLAAYCNEMNMPECTPDTSEPIDNILSEIAENTNSTEKNIIILEILGLVKSDGVYDDREKKFMLKLERGIGVKEDSLNKFNNLLDRYMVVYKELYTAVME